jgi:hypothetical protein
VIQECVLTISTLLAFVVVLSAAAISTLLALVALSRAAHAGPRITDKDYRLNEVHASSQSTTRHTAPDRYGARAMVPGVGRAQIVPEGTSGQHENLYRYKGGPFPFW